MAVAFYVGTREEGLVAKLSLPLFFIPGRVPFPQ